MGSEGREIYVTLIHEKKEEKDRTIKQDAFDDYCRQKKNEIVERYLFNTRKQGQGEIIETFIADVKTQAGKCKYGQLDLHLDRCVDICTAAEITKQGISVLFLVGRPRSIK